VADEPRDGPGHGRQGRGGRRSRGGRRRARRDRGQHRAGHPAGPGRAEDDPAGARHPARAAGQRDRGIPAPVPGAGLERRAGLARAGPPRGGRRDRRALWTGSGRADRPFHGRPGGVPGGGAPGRVGRRRAGSLAAPDRAGGPAGGPPGPAGARDRRPHHQSRGNLGLRRARPFRHPDGHDRGARGRAHHAAPGPALASPGGRVQPPVARAARQPGRRDDGLRSARRTPAPGVIGRSAVRRPG
jgi:translation initiation factor IF-2